MKTQNQINGKLQSFLLAAHPVGSYYWSSDATSPAELFGGMWERIENRFVFAAGAGHTVGSTGGEENHVLSISEMPSHSHDEVIDYGGVPTPYTLQAGTGSPTNGHYIKGTISYTGNRLTTGLSGNSQPHNNMPPYITAYCWCRTA